MPVRSSTVPTVRAATLGPEQHDTGWPPARDTMLGPLPDLSSPQPDLGPGPAPPCPPRAHGARLSLPCPGPVSCLSPAARTTRAVRPLRQGQPGVQPPKGSSWEGAWLGQLPPSLPAFLALRTRSPPNDAALLSLLHHPAPCFLGPLPSNFPRASWNDP